jgi:hypothetical protein
MTIYRFPTWREEITPVPQLRIKLDSLADLHRVMELRGFMSGYALAKAAGLTPGVVNHLVHGHRKTCSARTARLISEALQTPLDNLFVVEKSTVHDDRRRVA